MIWNIAAPTLQHCCKSLPVCIPKQLLKLCGYTGPGLSGTINFFNHTMILRTCGTHDGTFHADEVTACGLLVLFDCIDRDQIIRTRDSEKLERCEFVCDVGGLYDPSTKRFDHHQAEYRGDLSSAGMILLYFKECQIISEEVYHFFNRALILGIDAHDNGRVTPQTESCTFSHVITNFVPVVYDAPPSVQNGAFFQALDFTVGHLKRLLERFQYIRSCREAVALSMQTQERYLVFEKALPWMDSFFDLGGVNHPALFVIMPSGGHWKLRGIPPTIEDKMKVRMPLPQEWAGLIDQELKQISKIPGAIFCHKGRFISVWETREDAFNALNYVLNG